MKNFFSVAFFLALISFSCANNSTDLIVDEIAIRVKNSSREFSFTNKRYSQFYGLTNSQFNDGWQGLTYKEQRLFNDYKIFVDDKELIRSESEAIVYPYKIVREFKNGISEEFFIPDNYEAVFIRLVNCKGRKIRIEFVGNGIEGEYIKEGDVYLRNISNIIPGEFLFVASDLRISNLFSKEKLVLEFNDNDKDYITLSLGIKSKEVTSSELPKKYDLLINEKKIRLDKLLNENYVKTNDDEFNKAFLWAIVSLDALVTEQNSKGIFAGLPWFNNYWGRDTFISLPGATFLLGNYKDAKDILLSFAKYQDTNTNSSFYGRIPNRITLNETIYNTVDGTPWFIIQAYNFYKCTGDIQFVKDIYPSIKTAFKGAMKNYVDNKGFLTHKDAETWMDAVGDKGPWSPRGNRANDIQALWYLQLKYSSAFADLLKDFEFSEEVDKQIVLLETNFEKYFLNDSKNLIFDRLTVEGEQDSSVRPNQFFVLNTAYLISDYKIKLAILENAMKKLVTNYGVLSLAYDDLNFHPFHKHPPFYVKDAAYHNGIIWTWNSGPVIEALCNFDLQNIAYQLTSELTNQILYQGAVGTMSELTDALPKPNSKEVELSGTFSQAWSLAEYIRNVYNNYLGAKPDAPNNTLYLIPSIPSKWKEVEFRQRIGNNSVKIKYINNNEKICVHIAADRINDSLDIGVSLLNKAGANYQLKTNVKKGNSLIVEIPAYSTNKKDLSVLINGKPTSYGFDFYLDKIDNSKLYEKIDFAKPTISENLKSLKGPGYDLLSNAQIKDVGGVYNLIFAGQDELDDENFTYPTNPNFVKGILDISEAEIKENENNYLFSLKFKELNNPGWHNEYGFQLTLAAICICEKGYKNRIIGLSSGYVLPEGIGIKNLIIVGGGVEIKDSDGNIKAAYIPIPSDISNPLGNTKTKMVEFTIPKKYIGKINENSEILILVGAQDDHGGAGIGEFRQVDKIASEWSGGHKGELSKSGTRVYDIMKLKKQ